MPRAMPVAMVVVRALSAITVTPALTLALALSVPARAAVVRTLDGKGFEGDVRIEQADLCVLSPTTRQKTIVPLATVLSVDLRPTARLNPPGETAAPQPTEAELEERRLSDVTRWKRQDIGAARPEAKVEGDARRLTIEAAGLEVGGAADPRTDQFFFLHRPMKGDGELSAKVVDWTRQGNKAARVGLMFRESSDRQAAHVMVSMTGSSAYVQWRAKKGEPVRREAIGDSRPRFLRLTRQGERFAAWLSEDGREWRMAAERSVPLEVSALAGVALASRQEGTAARAVIEELRGTAGAVLASTTGQASAARAPRLVERGLLLRDGSTFHAELRGADDSIVRVVRRGEDRERAVPLTDVARILLRRPHRPANVSRTAATTGDVGGSASAAGGGEAQVGLVLGSGDFVEGRLREMRDGRVSISSVLFGLRRHAERDVAMVVLRPVARNADAAAFEVRCRDGSFFAARSLVLKDGHLVLDHALLGEVRVSWYELEALRAGRARLTALSELKPAAARGATPDAGDTFALDALPGGLPMRLGGAAVQRGVGMSAGTTVEWDVPAGATMLTGHVGVPDAILPAAALRFVVLGDGKELWRSPPRTSLDEPIEVALPLAGVRRLGLRVERPKETAGRADAHADVASLALWADVALVRGTHQ